MSKDERKFTFGYIILLGGRVILWCTKKHSYTTSSMMGSEYIACTTAMPEVVEEILFASRCYNLCEMKQ